MTALDWTLRPTHDGNVSEPWLNLAFGRRTADGGGTDQARFNQQAQGKPDPEFGHLFRFESGAGDTAQWASLNQQYPVVVLVGSTSYRVAVGDEGWMHTVIDPDPGMRDDLFWELHNDGGRVKSTIAPCGLLLGTPNEVALDSAEKMGHVVKDVEKSLDDQEWRAVYHHQLAQRYAYDDPQLARMLTISTPLEVADPLGFRPAPDQTTQSVTLRMCGGVTPAGGGNQADWHPNILVPGTQPIPNGKLHFLIGYHFAINNGGWLELYTWVHGQPIPATPQIKLTGINTMAWSSNGTLDLMYPQIGKYGWGILGAIFNSGFVFKPSKAAAIAALPNGSVSPVVHPCNLHEILPRRSGEIKVAWDVEPGAYGYHIYRNGVRVSRTFDPGAHGTKFSEAGTVDVAVAPFTANETKKDTLKV